MGESVQIPCYFIKAVGDCVIEWTFTNHKGETNTILSISADTVVVEDAYLDRVSTVMYNYPVLVNDASIELTELRNKDSGIYTCHVSQGGVEGNASVEVDIKGRPHKHTHTHSHNGTDSPIFSTS